MIVVSLMRALRSLFHPAIALIVLLPFAVAVLIWFGLLLVYWAPWSHALAAALHLDRAASALSAWHLGWFASASNAVVLIVLTGLVTLLTALFVVATIAMPVMVRVVGAHDYPDLVPAHGGTTLGSIANALGTLFIYLPVWLVTFAFWPLPPIGQILSLIATGWLNCRLFRYDALAEHASREEYRAIKAYADARFFTLGLIMAALQWIPVVNLVAPVYAGLVFIHAGLSELRRIRAATLQPLATTVLRPRPR